MTSPVAFQFPVVDTATAAIAVHVAFRFAFLFLFCFLAHLYTLCSVCLFHLLSRTTVRSKMVIFTRPIGYITLNFE